MGVTYFDAHHYKIYRRSNPFNKSYLHMFPWNLWCHCDHCSLGILRDINISQQRLHVAIIMRETTLTLWWTKSFQAPEKSLHFKCDWKSSLPSPTIFVSIVLGANSLSYSRDGIWYQLVQKSAFRRVMLLTKKNSLKLASLIISSRKHLATVSVSTVSSAKVTTTSVPVPTPQLNCWKAQVLGIITKQTFD